MSASELEVLLEQIGELLAEGTEDGEDAIELASVAGLAARMGASSADLAEVTAWRDGPGAALIDEGWDTIELDTFIEDVDAVCDGEASDEEIEEAIWEVDDLAAAAIWTRRTAKVLPVVKKVARTVRDAPDTFAHLADFAGDVLKLPNVAFDLDAYDFWVAVAQAGHAVAPE